MLGPEQFSKMVDEVADRKPKATARILVLANGRVLMGKRRDGRGWTEPGGHIDEGEMPIEAAKRELYEEAGIKAKKSELEFIDVISLNGFSVYCFVLRLEEEEEAHSDNDPDHEVKKWKWFEYEEGLPEKVMENLANENNVAIKLLKVV